MTLGYDKPLYFLRFDHRSDGRLRASFRQWWKEPQRVK